MGDKNPGRLDNSFTASEILLKTNGFHRSITFLERNDVRDISAPPLVDRLIIVADDADVGADLRQQVSLVFITEEKYGRPFLDAPMPRAYIKYLAELGLNVSVEYVRQEL